MTTYTRNNENPANATPVWITGTPGTGPAGPTPGFVASGTDYETVAASQTNQILGATGAVGDYLGGITIQPGTTTPGAVVVKDGSTTVYTFPGGASSVNGLYPFFVAISGKSVSGAWNVTTGANVTVFAGGSFTA